jgi:large subunit ribosomal protein L43
MKFVASLLHLLELWLIENCSAFIKHYLPAFVAKHPQIEFSVSPRPRKHPVIIGSYINGRQRAVCVRNLQPNQIIKKVEALRDSNGEKNKRTSKPVTSINESVRGIWSPYHGDGMAV